VTDERARVLALIERHGWNATAFQTLESEFSYFFRGDDACVAYVDTGRAWVAAGAPIAAAEDVGVVASAFVAAARAAGRRCCFFATESRLREAAGDALRSLHIGEQPVWDPCEWPNILGRHRSLREQLRRARAKGVRIRRVHGHELEEPALQEAIHRVASRWMATRGMAPMGFLVRVELFSFLSHRVCFLAEMEGQLVGFAGVVPVPARSGWFIEDLIRDPAAPNGTGELLVDGVMRWAAARGSRWLTLGLAPLAGEVAGVMRLARRGGRLLYDFRGLHTFKSKLRPGSWSDISLSYPPTQGPLVSMLDALVAFTRGGFVRFAIRSALRGPDLAVRALAVLLIPWTILLALAPAEHWFGSGWVKWSWVAFDTALAAGLFRLLARPSRRLATLLACAVSADALVTLLEAVAWNLPRMRGVLDVLLVALACAAPALAAVMLWGARRRLGIPPAMLG
jgi:phosphatidylglycerol lysyltransferase